jgi:hypothetical protein
MSASVRSRRRPFYGASKSLAIHRAVAIVRPRRANRDIMNFPRGSITPTNDLATNGGLSGLSRILRLRCCVGRFATTSRISAGTRNGCDNFVTCDAKSILKYRTTVETNYRMIKLRKPSEMVAELAAAGIN